MECQRGYYIVIIVIVVIEVILWRAKCWLSTFKTKMKKNVPNRFEQWREEPEEEKKSLTWRAGVGLHYLDQ